MSVSSTPRFTRFFTPLLAAFTVALLLAGCLPIELDVSKKGLILIPRAEGYFTFDPATNTATRVYVPDKAKPAFGLFLPDGNSIIAINESAEGGGMGMGMNFGIQHVELPAGTARAIYSGSNFTYATVSPDGASLALTRVADEQTAGIDENMPELMLIAIKEGASKQTAANVAPLVRWFPDSKSVLAYTISSKNAEKSNYTGNMIRIGMDGTPTPLAAVVSSKDIFIDLSPDGSKAVFTALGAAKAGQEVTPAEEPSLFELDIASGEVKKIGDAVTYAIFSPDGKKLLIGSVEKNEKISLAVADVATPGTTTPVAPEISASIGSGMGPSSSIYPQWVGNDSVQYLASRASFGTAGINLHLVTAKLGGKPVDHQSQLDAAAIATE